MFTLGGLTTRAARVGPLDEASGCVDVAGAVSALVRQWPCLVWSRPAWVGWRQGEEIVNG